MPKIIQKIIYWIKNPSYSWNRIISPILDATGYDRTQWARIVMDRKITQQLEKMGFEGKSVLEVSPGHHGSRWERFDFKLYQYVNYPEFDICNDRLSELFDVVIADQVFEHIEYPYRAAKNIQLMLKKGGVFVCTTPFLIRFHGCPNDVSRWSELGLRRLLEEAGFSEENIVTGSWGNRACVKANLIKTGWASYGWGRSLKNDPQFPVVIWALAKN